MLLGYTEFRNEGMEVHNRSDMVNSVKSRGLKYTEYADTMETISYGYDKIAIETWVHNMGLEIQRLVKGGGYG